MRTLALVALAGCGWQHLPHQSSQSLPNDLWDPKTVIPAADGLYVPLPQQYGLSLVKESGAMSLVDFKGAALADVSVSPDRTRLLSRVESESCKDKDKTIDKCDADRILITNALDVVQGGKVVRTIAFDGPYGDFAWSPDDKHAIAWLDLAKAGDVQGVVDLNAVRVVDLDAGTSTPVGVGFPATQVVFTSDGTKALVLSQNAVSVIDLSAGTPVKDVTFPLTLNPDESVTPVGVAVTPDDRFALLSIQGSKDLYVLDLQEHSVNIITLSGTPSSMDVDAAANRTVFAYAGTSSVDVLDHSFFDVQTIPLSQAASDILPATGFALLYELGSGPDVFRLDLATSQVVKYHLEASLISIVMDPTQRYAVAFTSGGFGGRPGMEVLDLQDAHGRTYPFLLQAEGVGVAFWGGTDSQDLHAVVLQSGVRDLYDLNLTAGTNLRVDLPDDPIGLGTLPGGKLYVPYNSPLGELSFFDPTHPDNLTDVSGFALLGLLTPPPHHTGS